MDKNLNEIKNKFTINHAARMEELNKAMSSLEKTQAQKPEETQNTKTLRRLNDLLASL